MLDEKVTIGFLIEHEIKHGTDYIVARVVGRREGEDYPRGLSDHPADGLAMRGHFYHGGDDAPVLIGFRPEYYDTYCIDLPRAKRMVKTLTKVEARIQKECAWGDEPGDILSATAKAIGATFCVFKAGQRHGSLYEDCDWFFVELRHGKTKLRELIASVRTEVEKKGRAA